MKNTLFNCFNTIINEANIHSYAELCNPCNNPTQKEKLGEALMQHVNVSFLNKIFNRPVLNKYNLNKQVFLNATSMDAEDLCCEIIAFLIKKIDKLFKAFSAATLNSNYPENAFNNYITVMSTNYIIDLYRKVAVETEYTYIDSNGLPVTKKGLIPVPTNFSQCLYLDGKAFSSSEESETTLGEHVPDENGLSVESTELIKSRLYWALKQFSGNNILQFLASSQGFSVDKLSKAAEEYGGTKRDFTRFLAGEYLSENSVLNLDTKTFWDIVNNAHYGTGLSKKSLEKDHSEFIKKQNSLTDEYYRM